MGYFENDFILRAVQQFGRMIKRVLQLKEENREDEAERVVADAYLDIFGVDRRFFDLMDTHTVLSALGHPRKALAFTELLIEEARLLDRRDPARAADLRRRARELLAAVRIEGSDGRAERERLAAKL